jgi:predicted nucleic-acid-binding protein
VIAIDTNVLVRLLVRDDAAQGDAARALFAREEVWIGKTVLFETIWVLRAVYEIKEATILQALESALGLPGVHVEDSGSVARALAAAAAGMDITDALHAASTPAQARAFVTFDKKLARRGRSRLGPIEAL